ncbi:hypothetical protein I41_51210 [Lacipirellula limnantheis]|uniref:Uncharacterized protein n=1 Tax=Lacipirellula limnantheis TaxID=2528024 RepID=A0A517U5H7_9BACT|nr:hypothetical protein I41_51210 [Lacipirellula limnantheis]
MPAAGDLRCAKSRPRGLFQCYHYAHLTQRTQRLQKRRLVNHLPAACSLSAFTMFKSLSAKHFKNVGAGLGFGARGVKNGHLAVGFHLFDIAAESFELVGNVSQFQHILDPLYQRHLVDGLREEVIGPRVDRTLHVAVFVERRDH